MSDISLSTKVDKVDGKGLSTNDFTDIYKSKLDGIASGANAYTHPSYTAKSSGLYKITVDSTGHVSAVTTVTKADITGLGIPAQDTTYTHPSYTAKSSGFYKVTVDATGHISGATAVTKADITGLGIPAQDTTYSTTSSVTSGSSALITSGAVYTALAGKQNSLGFTPVQQGGGTSQGSNKIYIGWSGSRLKAQVDATDMGNFVFDSQLTWSNIQSKPSSFTPASHNQAASTITAGTLAGQVVANATAVATLGTKQVRNIYAGTTALTTNSSSLPTGDIYIQYE